MRVYLDELVNDGDVKVVQLRGVGGVFSAGSDMEQRLRGGTATVRRVCSLELRQDGCGVWHEAGLCDQRGACLNLPEPDSAVQRSELFHVCIVVPQIDTAGEHLMQLLGVEWGPVRRFPFPYRRADLTEAVVDDFTLCYSLGAPHLELVEGRPGSPWECNALHRTCTTSAIRSTTCRRAACTSQQRRARWVRTASTARVFSGGHTTTTSRASASRSSTPPAPNDGPADAR